ncbi:MAG TPA: ornithine carbamoyltransferase [Acidimicrobiales bacterium]
MKDLLRVADLSRGDLEHLLAVSEQVRAQPHAYARLLEGETVVTYFAKPSTRTRLSFGTAITRLGGVPEVVGPNELQLGRGETIEDTAAVISRYARAFVIRTFSDAAVARFAATATIPVVNALTDLHHPCQALADLLTMKQRFGELTGLRVAYLGDGNNVAHSLMEACALAGVDLVVATPPGYEPNPDVVAGAERVAAESGAVVITTHDPLAAAAGADVVYTDVWVSMGDSEDERAARTAALRPYQVNAAVMGGASSRAIFMHCLPAHRGEEVTWNVIDGPRSVVFDQAENRMHTAQALLVALVLRELHGAAVTVGAG